METTTGPSVSKPAPAAAAKAARALRGHDNLVATTVFRGTALLLGVFVLLLGASIALAAAGVIYVPDSSFHAPRLTVGLVGAGTFGPLGFALVIHGVRGISRRRRATREQSLAPDAPWRWDRAWGKAGEDAPHWRRARGAVIGAALFWLLLAAGIAVVFTTDAPAPVRIGVLLLSAIGLVPVWHAVRCVGEASRYGRTFVRWSPFPAFVGERITLRFGVARKAPMFTRVTFRMRCVEERVVDKDESGRPCDAEVVAFELYEAARTIDAPEALPRPHVEAVLPFEIPAGLPGTDLAADLPTYWELDVEGEAPGLDYRMRFLLPVYARA